MTYKIISTLFIITGLFLCLKITLSDVFIKPFERKRILKKRIRRITGKPKGKIERTIDNAKQMLIASGMEKQITTYKWMSLGLAIIGAVIGLALNNILASIVLAIGLAGVPLIIIYIQTGDYIRNLNEKLESAMITVTNSYVSSGDFIGAVYDSLNHLPAPVDNIFRQFYMQTHIDSNIVKAIHNMRDMLDNRYWKDWCNVLIQCQHDKELRKALLGIVKRLGEMRIAQIEADTAIRKHINYIITVFIVIGSIPLMGFMMPDWYTMLTTTMAGKITLAVIVAVVIISAIWVAQLYRPVQGGEKS